MDQANTNTLVIAPYTKRFGIAVFGQLELLHYAVHQYKAPWNRSGVRSSDAAPIGQMISDLRPKMILIKSLTVRQAKANAQQSFVQEIKQLAEAASVPCREVEIENLTGRRLAKSKTTKRDLFVNLAIIYPELARIVKFQNLSQEQYYRPLLSAIAIGTFSS
jgi:hypothetical protein